MADQDTRKDLLIEAGLALASELSLPAVLQRIVELAVQITGARYGAVGVLGPGKRIIEFITTGITAEQRHAIGHIPVGRGILGALIQEAEPLRLHDIKDDRRSVGFPPNHPAMQPFLGAPVTARGRVFGNIYLTREPGAGDFTAQDERALLVLASQAGVAVQNARLYDTLASVNGAWRRSARSPQRSWPGSNRRPSWSWWPGGRASWPAPAWPQWPYRQTTRARSS